MPLLFFSQNMKFLEWLRVKRNALLEMAFRNNVCYDYYGKSLVFSVRHALDFTSSSWEVKLLLPTLFFSSSQPFVFVLLLKNHWRLLLEFHVEPLAAGHGSLFSNSKKRLTENLRILIYCLREGSSYDTYDSRRQANHLQQWRKWPNFEKKSRIVKSCCVFI